MVLPEDKITLIPSTDGQLGLAGVIALSINESGGFYPDHEGIYNRLVYINNIKTCESILFCKDARILSKGKLKKILKENNIQADLENIKVEQIIEIFDKINNN